MESEGENFFEAGFNEEILDEITSAFDQATASGLSEEEALKRLEEAIPQALRAATDPLVNSLKASGHRMVLEHQAERQEFEARLLSRWLEPLCLYEMFLVAARDAGEDFNQSEHPEATEQNRWVGTALRMLHGRACLTGSEVLYLLRGGYPFGAQARWRTLHEMAVISSIISEHPEAAEAYLLHTTVTSAKDAIEYQARHETLGYEPLSAEEVERIEVEKSDLIKRFGWAYKNPYGWAVPLFNNQTDPKFRDLEELAQLDHLRSHYRRASHYLHAGPKGDALNLLERGGQAAILTGPTNNYLADAGHQALISLYQVTVSYLLHGRPGLDAEPIRLVVLHVLESLLEQAGDAFLSVQLELDAEEKAFWKEVGEGVEDDAEV
jgi:hypothetical protein